MNRQIDKIIIKVIEYDSAEQNESLKLRYEILRKPLGLAFDAEKLREEAAEIHIGAFYKTEISGILLLKPEKNIKGTLKMRQVAVKTEFQNKGIGKKLVDFAENWAKENNYFKIELNARLAAINFYLNNNYTTIGSEFIEVGIPHIKMFKSL